MYPSQSLLFMIREIATLLLSLLYVTHLFEVLFCCSSIIPEMLLNDSSTATSSSEEELDFEN